MSSRPSEAWWHERVVGPAWPGLQVCSTTRQGGVSVAPYLSFNLGHHVGDEPAAVAENRRRLRQALPAEPCWLNQVHGVGVWHADTARLIAPSGQAGAVGAAAPALALPVADAALTCRAQTVLAVLTADCLPVVLFDHKQPVLAVAHAGWRGLAAGVLETTVAAMVAQGAAPGSIQAWLGPAIGPQAFEVGQDVLAAMGPGAAWAFQPRLAVAGKWWCDLPALATARLQAAGCAAVVSSDLCTVSDARFYSYRRDGQTGRFVTLAWFNAMGPAMSSANR